MGGGRLFIEGRLLFEEIWRRRRLQCANPALTSPRDLRTFELFKTNPFKFPWQPNVVVKLMSHSKKKCTCFADCEFKKIDSCNEVFQTSLVDRQSGSTKIKHSISFPFIIPSKMQTCSFWSLCRTSHSFRKAVSLPLKWARLSDVDKVEIPHPTRPGNGQIPHSPGTSDGKCLGGRIDRRTTVTDCGCRLISAVGSVFGQYKSEPEF